MLFRQSGSVICTSFRVFLEDSGCVHEFAVKSRDLLFTGVSFSLELMEHAQLAFSFITFEQLLTL